MPLSRGCWLSVTERSVLCPLSLVRSCCRSISSLWRTCCHPGGRVWMWRSRSSLRGCYLRAVAPWFLAAFHRLCVLAEWALVWPGPARLDISLLTAWRLVLGPCFLVRAATIRRLPMGWHGWGFGYVSTFLKCCLCCYFLEILDFISSESLVPSSVTFDSFSSSALSIFMPGLIWKRGWECWSVSSSTSLRGSWSSTALRLATLGHHTS